MVQELTKIANEEKKKYLRSYRESVRRVNRIESELQEIRSMKNGISSSYDGMPHGQGGQDLSGYIVRLDSLERELLHERYRRIAIYEKILKQINRLKDENERDVLFYRYIKGLKWYEIAEKMIYSERHVVRLHGEALCHFNKDVIECQ